MVVEMGWFVCMIFDQLEEFEILEEEEEICQKGISGEGLCFWVLVWGEVRDINYIF